jgi:hypothetical protein
LGLISESGCEGKEATALPRIHAWPTIFLWELENSNLCINTIKYIMTSKLSFSNFSPLILAVTYMLSLINARLGFVIVMKAYK